MASLSSSAGAVDYSTIYFSFRKAVEVVQLAPGYRGTRLIIVCALHAIAAELMGPEPVRTF